MQDYPRCDLTTLLMVTLSITITCAFPALQSPNVRCERGPWVDELPCSIEDHLI